MCNMNKLTTKVKTGLQACAYAPKSCVGCSYVCFGQCVQQLTADTLKVIDYWKHKYESTLIAQPTMILPDPAPIRIEPVDVKATLKDIKTMDRMEKAAKRATDALDEASEAIRALKKELREFDEE